MRVIDMTRTLRPGMPVFPGDGGPVFRTAGVIEREGYAEREITMSSHTGTHMDAPAHVIAGGATLDMFPLSRFCGTACVVPCEAAAENGRITLEMIRRCRMSAEAEFLLLRSGWSALWGSEAYFRGYPVLTEEAAKWIVGTGKKGVGLDVMSLDPVEDEALPLHHIVLGGGKTVIIENLCSMDKLPEGLFRFCAFPLKLADADGSPVRAAAFLE